MHTTVSYPISADTVTITLLLSQILSHSMFILVSHKVSGDIDNGVLPHICRHLDYPPVAVSNTFWSHSMFIPYHLQTPSSSAICRRKLISHNASADTPPSSVHIYTLEQISNIIFLYLQIRRIVSYPISAATKPFRDNLSVYTPLTPLSTLHACPLMSADSEIICVHPSILSHVHPPHLNLPFMSLSVDTDLAFPKCISNGQPSILSRTPLPPGSI